MKSKRRRRRIKRRDGNNRTVGGRKLSEMFSPGIREASEVCYHGCCPNPFSGVTKPETATSVTSAAISRYEFEQVMASSIYPNSQFTNHESLPSLDESFSRFTQAFPQYSQTDQADEIREQEYYHLSLSNHACFDYTGHGLFSYSQQEIHYPASSMASTSTSLPPSTLDSTALESPFFHITYKSVGLNSQLQYGGPESDLENKMRQRIMTFMNISEDDYTLVFTANQSSAFKLVADSYPFQSHRNLLTLYDHEIEAVKVMIESSKQKGAQIMSAEFSWPSLRIRSGKLQKKVESKKKKRKKRGLFVFPLQSRVSGNRYSYLWMNMAQENGWHVLLDACGLGPKYMETIGFSIFKPDLLICSFFKVFGGNPSGFGCLFVKKSIASVLMDSTTAASRCIVSLVPAARPIHLQEDSSTANESSETSEIEVISGRKKAPEIEELETPPPETMIPESRIKGNTEEPKFKGLDHADSLGLILISSRTRYLVNWLVNALMSLQHPNSENEHPPVRIYGPKIKFDRGPAVAFNVFDWKGEKIDPEIVQKLADRNNISLTCGYLHHIWIPGKNEEERGKITGMENLNGKRVKSHPRVTVVTASIGFLTNFEDVYRLWAYISRFLDADFVEKERWRYTALNQNTIEV